MTELSLAKLARDNTGLSLANLAMDNFVAISSKFDKNSDEIVPS